MKRKNSSLVLGREQFFLLSIEKSKKLLKKVEVCCILKKI